MIVGDCVRAFPFMIHVKYMNRTKLVVALTQEFAHTVFLPVSVLWGIVGAMCHDGFLVAVSVLRGTVGAPCRNDGGCLTVFSQCDYTAQPAICRCIEGYYQFQRTCSEYSRNYLNPIGPTCPARFRRLPQNGVYNSQTSKSLHQHVHVDVHQHVPYILHVYLRIYIYMHPTLHM